MSRLFDESIVLLWALVLISILEVSTFHVGNVFNNGRSKGSYFLSSPTYPQHRTTILQTSTLPEQPDENDAPPKILDARLTLEGEGPIQRGFWVPNRVFATANYLIPLRDSIEAKRKAGLLKEYTPVITAFKEFVTTSSVYRMWVSLMISQANDFINNNNATKGELERDGDFDEILTFDLFFDSLNEIVTTSPEFSNSAMVGTPMNGLLAVSMGTEAGTALFHDAGFNKELKKVLDSWNEFLGSDRSLDKLDINHPEKEGSWISPAAFDAGVWCDMDYNASKPAYGFESWNDFFTRNLTSGARPFLGNPTTDVFLGCETTPWEYTKESQIENDFWIKDGNYSLLDLFGGQREIANIFEGGQIYQGFLSATRYHRWQSPIDGELIASWVEPGTYFAQRPDQGENSSTFEGTDVQPYLGHVATRAIFLFNHEFCGVFAMILIGMVEVSTCYIEPEYHYPLTELARNWKEASTIPVKLGDLIGKFEFGGSTHMLVFQKDQVKPLEDFARNAVNYRNSPEPIPLGTKIATAASTIPVDKKGPNPDKVRIIAALVNPRGNDGGKETVTLMYNGDAAINLDKWTIAGRNGKTFSISDIVLSKGATHTILLPENTAQLTNYVAGVIELRDDSGNLIHSVTYRPGQTKRSGDTILF